MAWAGARPGTALVPPASTSAPKPRIEPLALARAFRRRWLPATLLGIVLGTIAGAVTWKVVPAAKYTATARLHVASVAPMVMYKTREPAPEYATFRQTQLALLKSQQVIDTALSQPEAQALQVVRSKADPAEWLQEQLSVTFSNNSEVLEIAMSGDDPKALAVLVNAVTEAYLQEVVNVDHANHRKRLDGLKGAWKKYDDDLHQKQERLRKIAEAVGINDKAALTLQQQYDVDRQDLIRRRLIEVRDELLKHRAELDLAADKNRKGREASNREVADAAVEEELAYDPIIARHVERIRSLKAEVMRNSRTMRNPAMDPAAISVRAEIRAEELALNERRRKLRPQVEAKLRGEMKPGGTNDFESLRDQVSMLERLEAQYKAELEGIKEETRELNNKTFHLGLLRAEVELDEKAAREVGDEIRHQELELNQAPPRIKTFEKAKVPRAKDRDKRVRFAAAAGVGVFALIVLGITFWEYQARRVGSVDDVVKNGGIRVVGALPVQSARTGRILALGEHAHQPPRGDRLLIESVDATRMMLLRTVQPQSARVVMITSATVGEGKTSLSCHLAVSLARSGRRTLLIDADLRRPSVHRLWELPLEPGLCEYLRGQVELPDVIGPAPLANLRVMSAGSCDEEALTALARRDLRPVFAALRAENDFIILDSAPVLHVADTLVIGQQVDAVVLSIMNDVSRIPEVLGANDRLRNLGIQVVGAVVAGVREGRYARSAYAYRYSTRGADSGTRDSTGAA
jgi:capsular exopolysaccharide synthesis family protein